jgi:membrane protein implicated in regulation of membrane protease activity
LIDPRKDKWYFGISTLVVSFLCVGPLALPLVWFNPNFNKKLKITLTAVILVISYLLGVVFVRSLNAINNYYKLLSG